MSIDTLAYLQLNRPVPTAAELLDAVRSDCPHLQRLRTQMYDYLDSHRSTPLDREEWRIQTERGLPSLGCPHFDVTVGNTNMLHFYFGFRHPYFAKPEVREVFRRACAEIAAFCGTTTAVYVPELGHDSRGDLQLLIKSLREEYGEPAKDLDTLVALAAQARDYFHPGCYYVDQLL